MNKGAEVIPMERIQNFIFLIRGEKVMLDSHLAELYGVETKALNRAVRRNADRFPNDFMFQLSKEELENLRCQIGTSSLEYGGRRYLHGQISCQILGSKEGEAIKFKLGDYHYFESGLEKMLSKRA